jgi:hypothetical protein
MLNIYNSQLLLVRIRTSLNNSSTYTTSIISATWASYTSRTLSAFTLPAHGTLHETRVVNAIVAPGITTIVTSSHTVYTLDSRITETISAVFLELDDGTARFRDVTFLVKAIGQTWTLAKGWKNL